MLFIVIILFSDIKERQYPNFYTARFLNSGGLIDYNFENYLLETKEWQVLFFQFLVSDPAQNNKQCMRWLSNWI